MRVTAVAGYRALLRLYPRGFRDEYGVDMELLFTASLRDEPRGRVIARTLVDLAATVPTRHLEAHVHRSPKPTMVLPIAAVSVTALALVTVGGTNRAVLLVGVPVALLAALLAALVWREGRPVQTPHAATAHRWRYLAGGAGLLVAVKVVTTATGELPSGWWWVAMATILGGLVLLAIGLVLTVAHLAAHVAHRPAG